MFVVYLSLSHTSSAPSSERWCFITQKLDSEVGDWTSGASACGSSSTHIDSLVFQSAARQGNRLHMNVYETRGQPAKVAITKASGTEPKRGFRPPQHCPSLAQVVSRKVQAAVPEQGMVRPPTQVLI